MKLKLLSLFFLVGIFSSFAFQIQLSEDATVSVLTIGPGESLNDAFGHNAIRILDRKQGINFVYGYGEYDFDTPNFYLKFAQGKLNYLISRDDFHDFYKRYVYYNRSIKEQVLNLSTEEKRRLFEYLENNYRPENRRYLYDFFYDNCATRIRDVTEIVTKNQVEFHVPQNFEPKTFRALIHDHVGLNTWGSFGIDIALGAVIDREASEQQHMFLPKYIHTFFDTAYSNERDKLVERSTVLYEKKDTPTSSNFLWSPLMIVGLISVLILFFTYKDYKSNSRNKYLDIVLFGLTGSIGVLLLLLWFATDHTATAQNYNVLWAVPLNIFVIAQVFKNQVNNWFKNYLKFLMIMLCLMTLHWIIGVQVFSIGLIPLMMALFVRYAYLIRFYNQKN